MKYLGIDFDNTLVSYDELFHKVALELNLIEVDMEKSKTAIRDYLRARDQDNLFTLLQSEIYGKRIEEAIPFEGLLKAIKFIEAEGINISIISHKTKYPYRGPQYDLHSAALSWLKKEKIIH